MKKDETITLYRRLAESFCQQGLSQNALDCYLYLEKLSPENNSHWLYLQGLCFRQLGQWEHALDCFLHCQLQQISSDPWLYAEMAEAFQMMDCQESAVRCWWAALQLTPEPWFYYHLINLFEKNGYILKALQIAELAREQTIALPDPDLYTQLFRLYLNHLQLEQATECLHQAYCLLSSGNHPTFTEQISEPLNEQLTPVQKRYFLARMTARHDLLGSISLLNEALELEPEWADLYFYRANLYFVFGQWQESLFDLNRYLAVFPTNLMARGLRGMLYYELDDLEEAIVELTYTFQQNPLNTSFGNTLFAVYLEQRNFDAAAALLTEIEQRIITVYPLEDMQIRLYQLNGQIQQALRKLEKVNPRDALYPRQLLRLARLHASMSELEKAQEVCMEAFEQAPEDESLILSVVSLLLQFGRLEKAQEVFSAIRELPQPEYLRKWTHYLLSWISFHNGELDEALIWIESNLETESGKGEPRDYMLLGYILSWLGRYEEAEMAFAQAHTPQLCPDVQLNIAFCAFNKGDFKGARQLFGVIETDSCEWIKDYLNSHQFVN